MLSTLRYITAAGAAALALDAGSAAAQVVSVAPAPASMPLGLASPPPPGFLELCERTPQECHSTTRITGEELSEIRTWANRTRWRAAFAAVGIVPVTEGPASTAVPPAAPPAAFGPRSGRDAAAVRPAPLTVATAEKPFASPVEQRARKDAARKQHRLKTKGSGGIASVRASRMVISPRGLLAGLAGSRTAVAPAAATPAAALPAPPLAVASPGLLQAVNRRINRAVRRASDADAFGREDFWALPVGDRASGDCEDYVLAKRRALIEEGVAPAALSIAIVRTRRGETHAVLLVATSEGEQVLDNLSPWVLRWDQAPYEWLERQAPGQALNWVSIGAARSAA